MAKRTKRVWKVWVFSDLDVDLRVPPGHTLVFSKQWTRRPKLIPATLTLTGKPKEKKR